MYDSNRTETMRLLEDERRRAMARAAQRRAGTPLPRTGHRPASAIAQVLRAAANLLDRPTTHLAPAERVR